MQINFYATLRPIVGARTIDITLEEGTTVQQLIDTVIERYPPLRDQLVNAEGRLYPHVHVFVNGRDAPYLGAAFETPLASNDTIDIFPAVAGG
jgi:molybdopterin synthase sulfur carrier subunit